MLTFAWNIRDRSTMRLIGAFVVLALLMAAFFLVFRVAYPTMQRASATPQRIVVLDPADPAARAIINRAQDKSFALFPVESRDTPANTRLPAFEPSFRDARMHLVPMLPTPAVTRQPQLFTPATSVLPAVPPRATLPPQAPPAAVLRAVPGADLAKRAPADLTLSDIPLADPHSVQFRAAIGAAGEVLVALPLGSIDDPALMQRLHAAITALRFKPDPKTPRQWGTLSFRWESP
ncbi:MAG: hypothetical protein JNG86_21475 [Verrucomicrobiaceae bacterium]|nr:hypothetical protein [Verrucomicrobiaceae bacterium]